MSCDITGHLTTSINSPIVNCPSIAYNSFLGTFPLLPVHNLRIRRVPTLNSRLRTSRTQHTHSARHEVPKHLVALAARAAAILGKVGDLGGAARARRRKRRAVAVIARCRVLIPALVDKLAGRRDGGGDDGSVAAAESAEARGEDGAERVHLID